MPPFWWSALVGTAIIVASGMLWRRWRTTQLAARKTLAMLVFQDRRDELAAQFLAAASASGKPRGLRWKNCEFQPACSFAEDRANGELVALVGAAISFEAVEGGDMEDVEAVGSIRSATAVFVYRQGEWTTDGRTVFNLEPAQTLERFEASLAPVAAT